MSHRPLKAVVIRKVKRPEGIARWSAYVMGSDRHGLWLYSPQGTLYRSQIGSDVGECEVGQGSREAGIPVMHLIPTAAWWTAAWCSDGHNAVLSVDICTPPTLVDGEWCYTDLELDPIRHSDGRVEIHDEDEFVEAREAGLIAWDEAIKARSAAEEVERCLRDRTEPFGRYGWDKLDEALKLSLSPIRVLRHISTA